MPNFEQPVFGGTGMADRQPHTVEELLNDRNIQELLARHDAFQPTGDALADGIRFEQFDNNGDLVHLYKDRRSALRNLVAYRQGFQKLLREQHFHPLPSLVLPKRIEILDRLLTYYGVEAQTVQEFDKEVPEQEAKAQ